MVSDRSVGASPGWRWRFRQWRRYWLRDPLLAAANMSLLGLARGLPTEWTSRLGSFAGWANGRTRYKPVRERARQGYLSLSGGAASAEEAERAADRVMENTGRAMLEFAVLDRLWHEGRIEVSGLEHLHAAQRAERPMIGACLHLGNWEVLGVVLVALGFDFKSFYKVPKSRFEERIVLGARGRYGVKLLQPGVGPTREALRLLVEERGILGIYVDEDRGGYVNAPLFGRQPAMRSNLVVAVRLAMASGAALIPSYVERVQGARFRTVFMPPVELVEAGGDRAVALEENIRRLDRAITPPILARLDQWYQLLEYYRPERF